VAPPHRRRLPELLSDTNARLATARRLTDRRARRESGRFLAEGAQAVREALRCPGAVDEVFVTAAAIERHDWLPAMASEAGISLDTVSVKAAAALSETVTPQGLVAVCPRRDVTFAEVLSRNPQLVAALVDANDPGNVGTVLRTADAAGAEAVALIGGVDLYNGKCVRASAGSLFHIDTIVETDGSEWLAAAASGGLNRFATAVNGDRDLGDLIRDQTLSQPTLWIIGSEAHGLSEQVLGAADARVSVPIYGRAESLNMAVAAAICLYASALAQHP
jgi:TrmH family RNA methyltransferase